MRGENYILPKFYRRVGFWFFSLAIFIFVFTFYLIWAKVTIIITPAAEKMNQELSFEVKAAAVLPALADSNVVAGKVRSVLVEGSGNFIASGSASAASDVVGEVTITNNYSKDQTLVATTRLAAPDNPEKILVRLKKTVVVPAGQDLKVQVYPDDLENFSEIEPMRFIIPGLWGPLQDKIYAQNSEILRPGASSVAVVAQSDLDQAEENLKNQLYQKALAEVNQELAPQEALWPKLFSSQVEELNHNVNVGEQVAEFTTAMKLKAIIVVFDESQLIISARNQLKKMLPGEKQLVDLDPKSFSYAVESYNLETNEAKVKVSLEANSILANSAQLFDKSRLVGKTSEEVQAYFSQFPEVKSVEVKFQPGWLRKTPRLKDKIVIEIANR